MTLKVLSYVQHLKGVGHVFRAKRVAEALAGRGHSVTLVHGGFPIAGMTFEGVEVVQLNPPIRAADGGYKTLVTPDGTVVTDGIKTSRTSQILSIYERSAPDVLILESYPLARRQHRFELLPLLDRAKASAWRPLVIASVRDILERPSKPERIAEALGVFRQYVDRLLIHGDENFADVTANYPELAELSDLTTLTGIVAPDAAQAVTEDVGTDPAAPDVIVSIGGGAVGAHVIETAIAAKPLSHARDLSWLALTGPNMKEADVALLTKVAGAGDVGLKRFDPDLRRLLRSARLSIQQAGYNTVADLLTTHCAAILVPFAEGGETEQSVRARLLAERGRAIAVAEGELTAERLAEAIDQALAMDVPDWPVDLNGAARSAEIIESLAASHRRP